MNYERDDATFSADAYMAEGWGAGVAWYVRGWQTEPDEDTEWTGMEVRTGLVVATMVGDDRHFAFEPDELVPLDPEDFCRTCGQVGCGHNAILARIEEGQVTRKTDSTLVGTVQRQVNAITTSWSKAQAANIEDECVRRFGQKGWSLLPGHARAAYRNERLLYLVAAQVLEKYAPACLLIQSVTQHMEE